MAKRPSSIADLMAVVFIVALGLSLLLHADDPATKAVLLALAVAVPWIVGPIRVRYRQQITAEPTFAPFDPGGVDAPLSLRALIGRAGVDLASLGFRERGHYEAAYSVPGVEARLSLYECDATGDVAKVIIITAKRRRFTSLLFSTEYVDGTAFLTSDSVVVPVTPRAGRTRPDSMAFPDIADAGRLYEVHRRRKGHDPVCDDPIGDDAIAYLEAVGRAECRWFVECGYYYPDDASGVLRPTWKGACLMAWKALWPVGPIRRLRRRLRAARVLRELGLH